MRSSLLDFSQVKRNEKVNKTIVKKQKQSKLCDCISFQIFAFPLMLCICGLIVYYEGMITGIVNLNAIYNVLPTDLNENIDCDYDSNINVVNITAFKNEYRDDKYCIVTGGAGFIGSHIASICAIELNMNVIIIDDLSSGFISNIPNDERIIFKQGSLMNETFVDNIFEKYENITHIYHIAAYASVGLSHHIRVFNYENNFIVSTRLINYAVNYNVSTFIFTSSINVYGSGPYIGFDGKFNETMHLSPEEPYGISKTAVEYDLETAHKYYGLNYIIFRPHAVYGPNQNIFDRYRNVVGIFMNSILNNETMKIFGNGTQTRSFSYIDDVAPYISVSPFYKHVLNKKFNIGSEKSISLNELALNIIKIFIFENKLIRSVSNYNKLNIFTKYDNINNNNNNETEIISKLFNDQSIVEHIQSRQEVFHAHASQTFFNCMFHNKKLVTDLEIGLNNTLNWILSDAINYDLNNLNNFHEQTTFDSVEISKHLPSVWQSNNNQKVNISPKAQMHRNKKKKNLAILISGQIQRFIFKDQFGVLIENNNININTKIEWVIDVFIVLHNGTMSKPWGPNNIDPFGPPYMLNTTIQDIHKWYIQRGANNVLIKILNDTDMTRMINSSETFLFKNTNISQSDGLFRQDRYHNRWFRYLRMFYLRHLVFTLTLDMNIKYDMLTYWREDNYFLSPIDFNKLATYFQETQTAIAVNKYCGFHGLSDKIYVTNLEGAKLLFDETFDDFKYKMVEWVQMAHIRKTGKRRQHRLDPFQTEAFLTTVIQKAKYVKIDLHRTELRYINGKLCANPLYVRCTPQLKQKHNELICTNNNNNNLTII